MSADYLIPPKTGERIMLFSYTLQNFADARGEKYKRGVIKQGGVRKQGGG
jgi:hypothetical protein